MPTLMPKYGGRSKYRLLFTPPCQEHAPGIPIESEAQPSKHVRGPKAISVPKKRTMKTIAPISGPKPACFISCPPNRAVSLDTSYYYRTSCQAPRGHRCTMNAEKRAGLAGFRMALSALLRPFIKDDDHDASALMVIFLIFAAFFIIGKEVRF